MLPSADPLDADHIRVAAAADPWLTTTMAAKRALVCDVTIVRAARRGDLTGSRVGRRWRFRASAVDRWLETLRWTA